MLRRLFLFCCVSFFSICHTSVTAVPPSKEEELRFLTLMNSQLGNIIQQQNGIKGDYYEVKPLQDGGASFINSVYLITTTEGEELIIKIGNPIWKGHKTLNEVLALTFLKANSCIPVPEVLAFENNGERSLIKTEYIIMPRIKGRPLSSEIDRLYKDKKSYKKVLDQLAEIIAELKTNRFSHIGNFISNEDRSANLLIGGIVDFAGYEIAQPCKCYSEYAVHALNYYIHEMEVAVQKRSLDSEFYHKYISILKELLDSPNFRYLDQVDDQFVFSHQDFVMKNILISGDKVTAILDWEWSGSALPEIEPMTGFDFLQNDEDRLYFATKLEALGIKNFFAAPNSQRQLFYRLIGNVYTLVAFREWREGKLEHTAKFLNQKLEQRKIRINPDFDCESFLKEVAKDLDLCIQEFHELNSSC